MHLLPSVYDLIFTFTRGRAIGNETFYGDGLTGPEKKQSYKKKECKLGMCSSHFVPDSQRTPD